MLKFFILILLVVLTSNIASAEPVDPINKYAYMSIMKDDKVLGNKSSAKYIIIYSSLTCHHCASFFSKIFPELKAKYIDTNKIAFANRLFITDRVAMAGTMLSYCDISNYYNMSNALFKHNETWVKNEGYLESLEKIAGLAGMDKEKFNSCISNQNLQDKILEKQKLAAEALEMKHVPYIIINGKQYVGPHDLVSIEKAIEATI